MKTLIILCTLFLSTRLLAFELRVGDILLQPLACWSCGLIEAQEKSIYSHVGMVIETSPEVKVAEALGKVRTLSLGDYNARTEKGSRLSVRRLRRVDAVEFLETHKKEFQKYYQDEFNGLDYDHNFLWNNLDQNGFEKLYCSEFISKMYQGFLKIEIPVKRMKFDINRDGWLKFFQGNPPDDEWGNSPAIFERSDLFYEVGEI
jgi:hypothetical protein